LNIGEPDSKEGERQKRSRLIGSAVEGFSRRTPPVRAIAQSGASEEPGAGQEAAGVGVF